MSRKLKPSNHCQHGTDLSENRCGVCDAEEAEYESNIEQEMDREQEEAELEADARDEAEEGHDDE